MSKYRKDCHWSLRKDKYIGSPGLKFISLTINWIPNGYTNALCLEKVYPENNQPTMNLNPQH